jgi:hypothetical protein
MPGRPRVIQKIKMHPPRAVSPLAAGSLQRTAFALSRAAERLGEVEDAFGSEVLPTKGAPQRSHILRDQDDPVTGIDTLFG